jgi:hypothetical protein
MSADKVKPIPDTLSYAAKRPRLDKVTLDTNLIANDRATITGNFLTGEHSHVMVLCQLNGLTPCGEIGPATMPKRETTNRQV